MTDSIRSTGGQRVSIQKGNDNERTLANYREAAQIVAEVRAAQSSSESVQQQQEQQS